MAPPTVALGSESILNYISKSLPPRGSDDHTPPLKTPYAAIAIFCHACMIAVGFRLKGLGEDHKIGKVLVGFSKVSSTDGAGRGGVKPGGCQTLAF
jgi:hypothetical protein